MKKQRHVAAIGETKDFTKPEYAGNECQSLLMLYKIVRAATPIHG